MYHLKKGNIVSQVAKFCLITFKRRAKHFYKNHIFQKQRFYTKSLQNDSQEKKIDGIVRLTDLDVSRCQLPTRAKVDSDELPL